MIPITPFLQLDSLGKYQDKIVDLYKSDAALNQTIPHSIRKSTEWLLRMVNCYYSNKIEGNPTHPKELLRTQDSSKPKSKELSTEVMELMVHLEAQIKAKNSNIVNTDITEQWFIKDIHKSFYDGMSGDFLQITGADGEVAKDEVGNPLLIIPGQYRVRDVKVGKHIPPSHTDVSQYMKWVEAVYSLETLHGIHPVVAAAGLHHRLAWIHPFQDGNGRTIRLLTDCFMRGAGFGGYGLWSITRGFGRDTSSYYSALAAADQKNTSSSERGILTQSGLMNFTKYFIDTALDQVQFFTDLLEPRKLGIRIDYYFDMRSKGGLPSSDGVELPLLKIAARDIYRLLLEKGAMSRSAVCQHLDKSEQSLRPVFKQMENEGLISAKPKQDIELKLSVASVEFLFPQIW